MSFPISKDTLCCVEWILLSFASVLHLRNSKAVLDFH